MTGDRGLLPIYLNDHLAGAHVAEALSRRSASANRGTEHGDALEVLADELADDRQALEAIAARLEVGRDRLKIAAALAGERLGRLKPNGRLRGQSPLSPLTELDGLALAVGAMSACCATLRGLADDEPRLSAEEIDRLHGRSERRRELLEDRRAAVARAAFLEA